MAPRKTQQVLGEDIPPEMEVMRGAERRPHRHGVATVGLSLPIAHRSDLRVLVAVRFHFAQRVSPLLRGHLRLCLQDR